MFDKSVDGGQTFGADKVISALIPGWNIKVDGLPRCNGFATILCDISHSKNKGNLYAIFSDQRNGNQDADIFSLRSSDEGNSWDSPVRVNNDTTQYEQFMPASAIDQSTGYLYSVFYDRRNTNGGAQSDLYLARSTDGGRSFGNFRLTKNPIAIGAGVFFTDYIGIAALNSYIYPIWEQTNLSGSAIYMSDVIDTETIQNSVHEPDLQTGNLLAMHISPNPANTTITCYISYQPEQTISVILYDVMGRNVANIYAGRVSNNDQSFSYDTHQLPNGIYYCLAQSGPERIVQKIMITH